MAYIALKPIRFTKNYAVGETIPDSEVNPKMEKKLIEWGQIAKIAADTPPDNGENPPTPDNTPGGGENDPQSNGNDEGDKLPAEENGASGEHLEPPDDAGGEQTENNTGDGELACAVCGKKFANKGALAAHAKIHEKK